MDLRQLEYFVHVAELGSFTRASEALGVAQSALSRHVRSLEVELRQHLLHRDGRGARPTEAGKRLLLHSHGILMQVERARQEVTADRGAPVGTVSVGLPHSLGRILTVPLVVEFKRAFPQATLSLTEGLTIHLHEWLAAGRLDIALLHDPVPSSAIETDPIQYDELFLLSPIAKSSRRSTATISLEELVTHELILPRKPHPLRMLIEARLADIGKRPNVVLEIDAVPAIADLVDAGLGHGVVTMNATRVGTETRTFRYRRIVAPGLRSVLVIARSADRPSTTLATQVYQLIKSFIPNKLTGQSRISKSQFS